MASLVCVSWKPQSQTKYKKLVKYITSLVVFNVIDFFISNLIDNASNQITSFPPNSNIDLKEVTLGSKFVDHTIL